MDQDLTRLRERLDSDLTITELADGSGVVLDLAGRQVLALNATGLFLVQTIQSGVLDTTGLAHALHEEFAVSTQDASTDTLAFLAEIRRMLAG